MATPISGFAVVFAVVSKDSWCVRYHNPAFAEVYEMGDVFWKVFDVDVTSCARCGERLWMGKMFGGECYVNQLRFIAPSDLSQLRMPRLRTSTVPCNHTNFTSRTPRRQHPTPNTFFATANADYSS